jgi:hypothetical protein
MEHPEKPVQNSSAPEGSPGDKPNYCWSLVTLKCPRCRRGSMFSEKNAWNLRRTLKMPETCAECAQPFELELGFWYGTGYVSYGLTVAMSIASLIAWWVLIGLSAHDDRFFVWMAINSVLLIALQPWIMRVSRVIYLYFFVKYDPDYKNTPVHTFE